MSKIPYEAAVAVVEPTEDVVLYSNGENDNAYLDPWGIIDDFQFV